MRIIGGKNRATKLFTLEGKNTRPTLDRVKEPLFSILNFDLPDAIVLDLFAGSGAIGLESISRGAKKAILCDNSKEAIHIIEKNVDKLNVKNKVQIFNKDYLKTLEILKQENEKFNIIFLDPPYCTDFIEKSIQKIAEYDLLYKDGIIIVETDNRNEKFDNINKLNLFDIYDERRYGRVILMFLKQK